MTAPNDAQPAWSAQLWQYIDEPRRGWTNQLFSDSETSGTVDGEPIGPYRITALSASPDHEPGQLRPVLELDSWFCEPTQEPAVSGSAGWTGLSIHQEITALLSLILGIRLRGDDPVIHRRRDDGSVATYHPSARIMPSMPSSPWASPIIPGLAGKKADIAPVRIYLESLPGLPRQYTVPLVRAARQYADALWMSENEPELAWLMLVSAVEVAATSHQAATTDNAQLLKDSFPRSAKALVDSGGETLLAEAASTEFAGLLKSTARFLDFARTFLPDPPEPRTTDQAAQLSWSWGKMRDGLNKVYGHRSARLHAGVVFPWPLVIPPPAASDGLPAERFTEETYGTAGVSWPTADLPMTLAVFAHLVRGMLLRWWKAIANQASTETR